MAVATTNPNLLDAETAAKYLKISPAMVRRYCRERRLRCANVAGAWVIDPKDLAEFAKKPRRVGNPNFLRN